MAGPLMRVGVEAAGFQGLALLPAATKIKGSRVNLCKYLTHCEPGRVSRYLKQLRLQYQVEANVFY